MANVNLIIGDNSGTPPTGNIVRLYAYWNGALQTSEYPSSHDFVRGGDIKVGEALDGLGVIQEPVVDSRIWKIVWKEIDGDIFDIAGSFIFELRARKYSNTASYYYLGADTLGGANYLEVNPTRIKIIDVILSPVPNSENIKLVDTIMKYQVV